MDSEQGVPVSEPTQQTGRSPGEGMPYTLSSLFLPERVGICVNILESDRGIGKIVCHRGQISYGSRLAVKLFDPLSA